MASPFSWISLTAANDTEPVHGSASGAAAERARRFRQPGRGVTDGAAAPPALARRGLRGARLGVAVSRRQPNGLTATPPGSAAAGHGVREKTARCGRAPALRRPG